MMKSKRSHEGYLSIDNRAAPGVSHEVIGKIDAPVINAGAHYECATITCSHCQRVVLLNPMRTRERGYCRSCDHYVCDSPACNAACRPFVKFLDEAQERAFLNLGKG